MPRRAAEQQTGASERAVIPATSDDDLPRRLQIEKVFAFSDAVERLWVIASIDTLKRRPRLERLLAAPRWDIAIFDEAHHLSRIRYGGKVQATQNYRLAEDLRHHVRDLLFLSATPHQSDPYQFWSLVQLLDESLFESPEALLDHRGLLGRVMVRRTKREVTDPEGRPIFRRRQVHTHRFPLAIRERAFYDRLSDYLREGYDRAGLGQAKTRSRQRAVGFVMATFQRSWLRAPAPSARRSGGASSCCSPASRWRSNAVLAARRRPISPGGPSPSRRRCGA